MYDHEDRRTAAVERLQAKRDFKSHLLIYTLVNVMLIVIWAATGAGFFWPIWAIAGWGIGVAAHAWSVYGQRPFSENDIRKEMDDEHKIDAV